MKNRESDGRDDGVLASEFSRRAFLAKAGAAGLVVASGGLSQTRCRRPCLCGNPRYLSRSNVPARL